MVSSIWAHAIQPKLVNRRSREGVQLWLLTRMVSSIWAHASNLRYPVFCTWWTNVFPEAWRAPYGPMQKLVAVTKFPGRDQWERWRPGSSGWESWRHGELQMGPCKRYHTSLTGWTNIFPEAWWAPHGPMLDTAQTDFPITKMTQSRSRLLVVDKHGELHMGPCN